MWVGSALTHASLLTWTLTLTPTLWIFPLDVPQAERYYRGEDHHLPYPHDETFQMPYARQVRRWGLSWGRLGQRGYRKRVAHPRQMSGGGGSHRP